MREVEVEGGCRSERGGSRRWRDVGREVEVEGGGRSEKGGSRRWRIHIGKYILWEEKKN